MILIALVLLTLVIVRLVRWRVRVEITIARKKAARLLL